MNPANILVIEDDGIVARTIEKSLRDDQFRITVKDRGDKGLRAAQEMKPDLIILDIIMPDMDGYTVCRNLRADARLKNVPILFLTAKVKPQDKIAGFLAGGDDYLCKPFNIDELILRVQAILRRTRLTEVVENVGSSTVPQTESVSSVRSRKHEDIEHHLVVGSFILDTQSFELHTPRRGNVRLTPLQFDLVYHLMRHAGEAFSPGRLLDEVWDYPSGKGSPDLVRVHIKTLRERIEANPRVPAFLCTVPGKGYTVISDNTIPVKNSIPGQ